MLVTKTRSDTLAEKDVLDSLMMIFGSSDYQGGKEQVSSGKNVSSAIVRRRSSRVREDCDSLVCVGTPTSLQIITKTSCHRSKPRRLISSRHNSVVNRLNEKEIDSLDPFDESTFAIDPRNDKYPSNHPSLRKVRKSNQCSQDSHSEKAFGCKGIEAHVTQLNLLLENVACDENHPKINDIQKLQCTQTTPRHENIDSNTLRNSAHEIYSAEATNHILAATAEPTHLIDDTSISSNVWNMQSSVTDEDQLSRNTATASAQSISIASTERDYNLQKLQCTQTTPRHENIDSNTLRNSVHEMYSAEATNHISAATAEPTHLIDDASISSNVWNMQSSVTEEYQLSRNTATASAQSISIASTETDCKSISSIFERDIATISLDTNEKGLQRSINHDLKDEQNCSNSIPPYESENDFIPPFPSRTNASFCHPSSHDKREFSSREETSNDDGNANFDFSSTLSLFFSNIQVSSTEYNMNVMRLGNIDLRVKCRYCSTSTLIRDLPSFPDLISTATYFNMKHVRFCFNAPLTVTSSLIDLEGLDLWIDHSSLQRVEPSQRALNNDFIPLHRPGDDSLWERRISQIIRFKKEFRNCDIPQDSELGKWLENIVGRLGSISSKHHIQRLIDAGVDWPFQPRSTTQSTSSRAVAQENTATPATRTYATQPESDQADELLDLITGKQDSVTSSITSTTERDATNDQQLNQNLCNINVKPMRKKISLTPRIHGRREHPLRSKRTSLIVRNTTILKQYLGDGSQLDCEGDSCNSYYHPHEFYATKIGSQRKRHCSNPWSDLLFPGEGDGRITHMPTKRTRSRQSESDACADVLQNLFVATIAEV